MYASLNPTMYASSEAISTKNWVPGRYCAYLIPVRIVDLSICLSICLLYHVIETHFPEMHEV